MNEIPIVDMTDEGSMNNLEFEIFASNGSSAYRNDRERPHNGQPHTDDGIRGTQEVKGITMRDLKDCMIQGFLASSTDPTFQRKTVEINKEFQGTEYANSNTWRPHDLYEMPDDYDPMAVIQNVLAP